MPVQYLKDVSFSEPEAVHLFIYQSINLWIHTGASENMPLWYQKVSHELVVHH